MGIIEKSISDLIFLRTEPWKFDAVSLNGPTLQVLSEIDGAKTLGIISSRLDIALADIKEIVDRLGEMDLIRFADHRAGTPESPPGNPAIEGRNKKKRLIYRGVAYREATI